MAKAQPDLSPANHRFTRIMSTRGGLKDNLPHEYEPRFDSFASSEIMTESSFGWSEWTRISGRGKRGGRKKRSRGGSRDSEGKVGRKRRDKDGRVVKGPVLVEEFAEIGGVNADVAGNGGVGYVRDTEARRVRRKSSLEDGGVEGEGEGLGLVKRGVEEEVSTGKRKSIPRDTHSQPGTSTRSVSFQNVRKINSHRSSDPRWKYRGNRLRPMPALRKIIPTSTQSVASFKLLGLFARPRRMKSDRGTTIRSSQIRSRRSLASAERRKSDSSPNLSSLRRKNRGLPAREGRNGRRRRRHLARHGPSALQAATTDDIIEDSRELQYAAQSGSIGSKEEIDLADAGNLLTGGHGKIFQKRVGVSREERVQRVSAWQEQHLGDVGNSGETSGSGKRRELKRRPHSIGSANVEGRSYLDSYEKRSHRREKALLDDDDEEEAKLKSKRSGRAREIGPNKSRNRKTRSSHIPRRSRPGGFSNFSSHLERPRRQDSTQNNDDNVQGARRRPRSAPAGAGLTAGQKFANFAKGFHIHGRGNEGHERRVEDTRRGAGEERLRRRRRNDDTRVEREGIRETQIIATGGEAGRHSKPMWMRLIGK